MRPKRAKTESDNDDEFCQPANCDTGLNAPLGHRDWESKSII